MYEATHTENRNGFTIEIHYDANPSDPRKEFDHLGTLVCVSHRRMNVGDKVISSIGPWLSDMLDQLDLSYHDWDRQFIPTTPGMKEWVYGVVGGRRDYTYADYEYDLSRDGEEAIAEAWARIHESGKLILLPVYMYEHGGVALGTRSFSCIWDSGQIGFIYVTAEDVRIEWDVTRIRAELRTKIEDILRAEVQEYSNYLNGDVYGYMVLDPDGEVYDSCWGYYGFSDALDAARDAADTSTDTE